MLLIRKQTEEKIPQTATANEAINSQVPQVKFKTSVQLFHSWIWDSIYSTSCSQTGQVPKHAPWCVHIAGVYEML